MTRLSVEFDLLDALAKQAKEAGLLEPGVVERLVREALLSSRTAGLAKARDGSAASGLISSLPTAERIPARRSRPAADRHHAFTARPGTSA